MLRRWIEIPAAAPVPRPNDGITIVQHPRGGPLKLATNPNGVVGVSADGRLLYYNVNTEPGSSGSPCFDAHLDVMALHVGLQDAGAPPLVLRLGAKGVKVGVLMSAIVRDLADRGQPGLLASRFV